MLKLFMSATGKTFSNHTFNDGTDGRDNANPQSEIVTEVPENEDLQQHLANNLPQNMMSSLTESDLNDSLFGYDSMNFDTEQTTEQHNTASSTDINVPSVLSNHPMLNKITGQNGQQTEQAHNPNSAPNVVVNPDFINNRKNIAKHFGASIEETQQTSPKSRPLPVPPMKNRADINISDKKLVKLETNSDFSNAHFTLATKESLSLQNISVGHNNVQNVIIPRSFISTKFDLAATYNVKISKNNAWANNFKSETFYNILLNGSVVANAFVYKTDEHSITLQVQCSKQIKNSILKKLNAAEKTTEITTPDNNNTSVGHNNTQSLIIPHKFTSTEFVDLGAIYCFKISKSNALASAFKPKVFYNILSNGSIVANAFIYKTDEHSITLQVQCSKQIKNSILKKLNAAERITEITTPDNNNTTINKSETPQDKKAEDDKKGFFAYIKANPAKSTAIFLSGVAAIGLMGCAYHNREAISANFKMAINSEILRGFINTIQDFAVGLYNSVNLGFSRS